MEPDFFFFFQILVKADCVFVALFHFFFFYFQISWKRSKNLSADPTMTENYQSFCKGAITATFKKKTTNDVIIMHYPLFTFMPGRKGFFGGGGAFVPMAAVMTLTIK